MAAQIKPQPESRADRGTTEAQLIAGCAYLSRCVRARRSFGIVTAESPSALGLLLDRFPASLRGSLRDGTSTDTDIEADAGNAYHLVRLSRPVDTVREFLIGLLDGLGFEVEGVADGDLRNLLVVFLCHEASQNRRTVLFLEQATRFGPRVLDFIQTLAPVKVDGLPAMTIVLTGGPELNRVLDSSGMAAANLLARERFDLDRALSWIHNPRTANGVFPPAAAPREPMVRVAVPAVQERDEAFRKEIPKAKAALTRATMTVTFDGIVIDRRTLDGETLTIGRSRRNGLCIPSRFVSRLHAEIDGSGGHLRILDLGSTNGTWVNGTRIQTHELAAGDVVRIGNLKLRFEACTGTEADGADDGNR